MRKVVAAVTVLALVSGCSSSTSTAPVSTAGATKPAPTTPTSSRFAGDLRTLLVPIPPNASRTFPPGAPPDGQFTPELAAAVYNDPSFGPEQLRRAGDQRGAEVQLLEADGTWVGVILSQLDTADNAARYALGQQNGVTSSGNPFKSPVEIPGVPQGFVYQRSTISVNKRWFSEAFFAKNDISVELFVTGPKQLGPEKLISLAQAEYALLP